jgi:plastocyanin
VASGHLGAAVPAASADPVRVTISDFAFTPRVITIPVGTAVTWINKDDEPHAVVATEDRIFKSPALDTDESFAFTFMKPGKYEYFCSLHPHMTGTIVVE